jgi:hypothetical protein
MRYYCIHHIPKIDRKKYMEDIFLSNDICAEWITDFLPDSLFIKDHPKVYSEHASNKNFLNSNELSLYYKQLDVFRKTIETNENSIILEDDLKKTGFNFRFFCETVEKEFEETDGDFVFLGGSPHNQKTNFSNSLIYTEAGLMSRCAHCYMFKPKTAKKIFDFLSRPIAPFDWQLNYAIQNFDLQVYWTYNVILQRTEIGEEDSLLR